MNELLEVKRNETVRATSRAVPTHRPKGRRILLRAPETAIETVELVQPTVQPLSALVQELADRSSRKLLTPSPVRVAAKRLHKRMTDLFD